MFDANVMSIRGVTCLALMHAGQGIVQFARGVSDGLDYALKFFVSKTAFDAEGELYRDAVLGPLLPKIEGVSGNEGGEEGDAHGTPLPPFIAMEKGEALDEWSRRAKPDLFHSVAVRAMHVSSHLPPLSAAQATPESPLSTCFMLLSRHAAAAGLSQRQSCHVTVNECHLMM